MTRISSRSCLVALLTVMVMSVTSEKCNSKLDGQLFVATEGIIWHLNPQDYSRKSYVSAESPIKFAYSYVRNTLYYSDLNTRQVYALKDKSTKAQVVVAKQTEWLPWGVNVDDVNDKLYMTESFASAVHVYDLTSGDSSVVISSNITEPKDVEIDTDEGYLFVLDKHQILRAELDGSKPTPIYQEFTSIDQLFDEYPKDLTDDIIGSIHPRPDSTKVYRKSISIADLTLDVKFKRIYWVDTLKRTVESSDYNGHNIRVHYRDTSVEGNFESFASLAFLNGVVYWADDITKKVVKIEANESEVVLNGIETRAITAVSCEQRPKTDVNPCANNQCQNICLLSKSSQTGYSCACNIGLELAYDGKTCNSVEDFILFTQETYLRGQSLSESHKDVIEPSRFSVGKGSVIDFDAKSGIVYYTSMFPDDQLHEINLQNGQTKILKPDLLSKKTGDFAYDWTTKNLYYLTYYYADVTTLSVTNVDDPTYSKVLIKNVPRLVRGIVVHPNKGYVFFARLEEQRRHATISRLATDGTGLQVILDLEQVDSVDTLTVDYDEDRIYWTETRTRGNAVIRHANFDGQDVQKLDLVKSQGQGGASHLAFHDNYIYVISEAQFLYRVDKSGKNAVGLVNSQMPGSLSDVKVFSRTLQTTRLDHPCQSHSCQKFCFAVPTTESNNDLKATCGCPYGEKLAEDGASCVDNSKQEPAFLPCKYTSFKCNMQTA